ncbi:MAG TPA: hypothetical protein VGC66_09575 [Pyrinomonadaceae bacterium]|jgi:hypothetical protein
MITETNYTQDSVVQQPPNLQQAGVVQEFAHSLTYQRLTEFHLKRCAVKRDGNERTGQSLKNERSAVNSWLIFMGVTEFEPVREELGIKFPQSLADYLSALGKKVKSKQTLSDRKSALGRLRESFLDLMRTNGLPPGFNDALNFLITGSGLSAGQISRKTGVKERTLTNWMEGLVIPRSTSLKNVEKLEVFFRIARGSLSSRLPEAVWTKSPVCKGATPWRKHNRELVRLRYRLLELPDRVQDEWDDIVLFFTDPLWAASRGLKTNSEWRIRWNGDRCVTAKIKLEMLTSFFGFLCLPTTSDDIRLTGMGFDPQKLTVAMLGDADLVLKYLHFMKSRTLNNSFNSATINFLQFCASLLRKETGYLSQHSALGSRLLTPLSEDDWATWCKTNYRKIKEFKIFIKRSKNNGLRLSRDPFAAIADIIRQRQHPISALFEVTSNMETMTPLLESRSEQILAAHCRDIFLIRLLSSNPLRVENISMMTFIPKSHAEFEHACALYRQREKTKQPFDHSELYVDTDSASNLFQRRDGSWWLRFEDRDFKNAKAGNFQSGNGPSLYEVSVVRSVWHALVDYLFRHRAVLNSSHLGILQKTRAARGFAPLTHEEEIAINRCRYVFRTGPYGIPMLNDEKLLRKSGTEQVPISSLSAQVFSATSRYLPGSKGFRAHACRHLVATGYVKNHPRGYEEAAVALRNSAAMVRRHYSWVEVASLIKPWSDYYEELHEKFNNGGI